MKKKHLILLLINLISIYTFAQKNPPTPLFIDPNYYGSCDPEVVFNPSDSYWYIYYTSRRSLIEENFVATPIGVIRSKDLTQWEFMGYCKFDGIGGTKDAIATFWAPAIISNKGQLHMFVTWKSDTTTALGPWGGPSRIVHYSTSENDPVNGWEKVAEMHPTDINALDATTFILQDTCHVWFKGKKKSEKNKLHHLISTDFKNWKDAGITESDVFNESASGSNFEEAPYMFKWARAYWLITDPHKGLFVYKSNDAINWKFQGTILNEGGNRNSDNSMTRHCSVAVINNRAFIFYHVEPWRKYNMEKTGGAKQMPIFKQPTKNRRSVLQIAELKISNGKIVCNRDEVIKPPELN